MKPYQNQKSSKKKQIEKMFDSISFEYDKLNRLVSAGNDVKWRKKIYKISKKLNDLEGRLYRANSKFNERLCENDKLREEIDTLRLVFN